MSLTHQAHSVELAAPFDAFNPLDPGSSVLLWASMKPSSEVPAARSVRRLMLFCSSGQAEDRLAALEFDQIQVITVAKQWISTL